MSNGQIKTNKENIAYIVGKVDKIYERLESGTGKIAANRTAITYLKYIIGGLWAAALSFGVYIIKWRWIKINGTVKFYNSDKGFGFIKGEDNQDYFFHVSSLPTDYKPQDNEEVSFDPTSNDKGLAASNVQKAN